MQKKDYETAKFEIVLYETEDVMTDSSATKPTTDEYELPLIKN